MPCWHLERGPQTWPCYGPSAPNFVSRRAVLSKKVAGVPRIFIRNCIFAHSFIHHVRCSVVTCLHSYRESFCMRMHIYGHEYFRARFSWGETSRCAVMCVTSGCAATEKKSLRNTLPKSMNKEPRQRAGDTHDNTATFQTLGTAPSHFWLFFRTPRNFETLPNFSSLSCEFDFRKFSPSEQGTLQRRRTKNWR